ncbi:MAG: AmiS/UreI family transporter [Thermodesulfobacteriota bacterium]
MVVEQLLGYVLLLVGFVFFTNGMTLLGKTGGKEVGVLNLGVALLIVKAAWMLHEQGVTSAAALVSVFALIYLLVYAVFVHGHDAKGLGWFCLFATITFVWYALKVFPAGMSPEGVGMFGVFCLAWALLTLLCFFAFAQGKNLGTSIGYLFIIEAFLTLLIPGMMLLSGTWKPLSGGA